MKRLRIFCGICKKTKFYSINRGITKVSSIIACENCRHFYQKLKKNPFALDCISPIKGSCYKNCSFMKTRCKACWAMQVLDSCPHSNNLYSSLSEWLSEECKKQLRGIPLAQEDITDEMIGKVVLESYEIDEWVEAPSPEAELGQLPVSNDNDEDIQDMEEDSRIKSRSNSIDNPESNIGIGKVEDVTSLSLSELVIDTEEYIEVDDEAMVDDPTPMATDTDAAAEKYDRTSATQSNGSERIKRKRKKVEYFTKPAPGRKSKGGVYGPDGRLLRSGVDLCDCLQQECVGCHFPCPKCRSPKCGNECRVNRKWFYERVEVEGTKMFWVNRFVPKTA